MNNSSKRSTEFYLPKDASDRWKVALNDSKSALGVCEWQGVKRLGEDRAIPKSVCRLILREYGFPSVEEIHDGRWLMDVAFTCLVAKQVPTEFPYCTDFAEMIDDCIERETKQHLRRRMMSIGQSHGVSVKAIRKIGGNSRKKLVRDFGIPKRDELARLVLTRKLDCCFICLGNKTDGIKPMSCCGKLVHESCFSDWENNACPYCHGLGVLTNVITDLERVYAGPIDYGLQLMNSFAQLRIGL